MSAPPTISSQAHAEQRRRGALRRFWDRVTEGRQISDLWDQFTADARASYGFYEKDVDWDAAKKQRGPGRFFYVAKQFFWALMLKLSPARRVLFLFALVMLFFSGFKFETARNETVEFRYELFAALIFLVLLSLELADKVTMKRDLEVAREIQTWLVPSKPPDVAGAEIAFATRPQNSVAGDYYDAFYPKPEKRDRLIVVIADVAGKSVPAALLMATMQASLRTIAGENASLLDLVVRLNHYASAHSLDGLRFTTAVIGEYDPSSRRLTYVNAGHNAPILRRANGGLEILDIGGLPFGIQANTTYKAASVEFRPGDALILFTDGVVEAFNEKGQEFGSERWLGAIRNLPDWNAQETLQYLMKRVDEFVGATRQSDDITCLVLRSK